MENKNSDKIEKKPKDKEELEEEIKETEETIESENFNEFIQNTIEIPLIQNTSPSLEKINIVPEIPVRLEQGITDSHFTDDSDEENNFKYNFIKNNKDESKYQSDGEQIFTPQRTEIETLGKTNLFQKQEVGFIHTQEKRLTTQEDYINPNSQKIEELGKNENPFERKEIKYKPIR